MKTSKNITTKSTLTKVSNEIGMGLIRNLSIYSEKPKIHRHDSEQFVNFDVYSENAPFILTQAEYESVKEIVEKWQEKYPSCIFMVFDTFPVYASVTGGENRSFIHVPCFSITVRIRK